MLLWHRGRRLDLIIIIDKNTKKVINNMGTNSMFPEGNIPIELKENEACVRTHDDSDLAKKIMSAHKYDFVFDEDDKPVDIIIHKTLKQAQDEEKNKPENVLREVRAKRNALLAETDYLMLQDAPITLETQKEVKKYRKELRDITKQDINNIVFPTKPLILEV